MARASKYKYEKDDVIGLYRVIKVLPSEPNVKNLVIYAECLLCHEKVKRFSNRLDSKHRGCEAPAVVDKQADDAQPIVVAPVRHTRADGTPVVTDAKGFVVDDERAEAEEIVADANPVPEADDETEGAIVPESITLPPEVAEALNVDVDEQAIEIVRLAKNLDTSTKFIFINTLKRYLTLVHLARRLESKINVLSELTVTGSTGAQVANPLIVQYKQVSSESNAVIKVLLGIVHKMNASDDSDDPLLKALEG